MAKRRSRKSRSFAAQAFELGIAAPQVIAHRLARAGDHAEFHRMGFEKIAAFQEAWVAMATQAVLENQKYALGFMNSPWFPWSAATTSILGKGIAPIRRRAVANARRLRRIKR